MIRLVICIDVETDNPTEAYRTVSQALKTTGLDWESSDEWYDSDGTTGDTETLQTARMAVFAERS